MTAYRFKFDHASDEHTPHPKNGQRTLMNHAVCPLEPELALIPTHNFSLGFTTFRYAFLNGGPWQASPDPGGQGQLHYRWVMPMSCTSPQDAVGRAHCCGVLAKALSPDSGREMCCHFTVWSRMTMWKAEELPPTERTKETQEVILVWLLPAKPLYCDKQNI